MHIKQDCQSNWPAPACIFELAFGTMLGSGASDELAVCQRTEEAPTAIPAISDGVMYVRSSTGALFAIGAQK